MAPEDKQEWSLVEWSNSGGKTNKRKRRWWVQPWAGEERRQAKGFADILIWNSANLLNACHMVSVVSHAHKQTLTCDNFYLSKKLVRQFFSK